MQFSPASSYIFTRRSKYSPQHLVLKHPEYYVVLVEQWFSNGAAKIMKVYFKNEKKPIRIEIFIHGLKYINIFLILYTMCARKFLYVLQCREPKILRTTALEEQFHTHIK
jgi:hypothetical protein